MIALEDSQSGDMMRVLSNVMFSLAARLAAAPKKARRWLSVWENAPREDAEGALPQLATISTQPRIRSPYVF